jgi:hypothetical protein
MFRLTEIFFSLLFFDLGWRIWIRLTNVLVDARANIKQQIWTVGPFHERSSISFGHIFHFSFSKETDTGQLLKKRRLTLNKVWKFGRRIVKTLCTYFQFNSIKCIIYFQYSSVKMVSFLFYFPFSFIQLGSCSSQPLVSFCPFIACFSLFYKTYL